MKFNRRVSVLKKRRTSGYLKRRRSRDGLKTLKRRRQKGRKRLCPV
jgi:large subunit ribosomal protein L34